MGVDSEAPEVPGVVGVAALPSAEMFGLTSLGSSGVVAAPLHVKSHLNRAVVMEKFRLLLPRLAVPLADKGPFLS